jgi:hypothetical protein
VRRFAPHSAPTSTNEHQCHLPMDAFGTTASPVRTGLKGEITSFATFTFVMGQEF